MSRSPDFFMQEALAEARKGLGLTAPNPPVGAVVVRRGRIVGRGWHKKAGSPHAEPLALADAGAQAKGADLYVTLEPCCTTGRTPPCTDAILAAGIARVFIATIDPNPQHAGRGLEILRAGGCEVQVGLCQTEAKHLIRAFRHYQEQGLPYLSLKLASSLDGGIADARGRSKWISGPESRQRVQALRREVDAILVGTGTVMDDDPSLLPRPRYGRAPLRVVLDRANRLPLTAQVFSDAHARRTLCVVGEGVEERRLCQLEARGVQLLQVPARKDGFRLDVLLRALGQRGVRHVLCEGGGKLAASLVNAGLVQELYSVLAPRLLGLGRPAFHHAWRLAQAPFLAVTDVERLGSDLWLRSELRPPHGPT